MRAISGLKSLSEARVVLAVGDKNVHVPATTFQQFFQAKDDTLTALAALDGTAGILVQTGTDTFTKQDWITPWVAYTPTFTGFGTASGVSIWSRRMRDSLFIRGRFTSGTSTATEARMTLGFNGTNSNVTSDSTKVPNLQVAGSGFRSTSGAVMFSVLVESNIGYLTFGTQNSTTAGFAKANGNVFLSSGDTFSFTAEVPISGW